MGGLIHSQQRYLSTAMEDCNTVSVNRKNVTVSGRLLSSLLKAGGSGKVTHERDIFPYVFRDNCLLFRGEGAVGFLKLLFRDKLFPFEGVEEGVCSKRFDDEAIVIV
jgi:hypothetical protein